MPAEQKIVLQTKKQGSKDTRMNEKWIPLIQRSVRIKKKKQKMEIYIDDTPTYGTNSKITNKKIRKNFCKQSKEKQTNADDSY